MSNIGRKEFVSSAFWKILEMLSTRGVSLIISIILARLLLPENYGIVGITGVLISFSAIFVQSGINTALIRKETVDDLDYSSAFFFCMAIAGIFYAFFFAFAPAFARFYSEPLVAPVLRVQMLSLFLGALNTVRSAIIIREFKFKQLCVINLIATTLSGLIGLYLAYTGFGVWALVIYTLSNEAISALILFAVVRWKLIWRIDSARLKALISFSIWVLISSVLDFGGNNVYSLLIGRYYSMADLGFYNKGVQLPQIICLYVFGAITSVLLPTMAQSQNDIVRLKHITRKITRMSAFVLDPMMVGLAAVGARLVPFLFTKKWLPCLVSYWAACVSFGVNPYRTINIQLLYAKGRSKPALIIEAIRFSMLIAGLAVGVKLDLGINGLAWIQAGVAVINAFITHLFSKDVCGYSTWEWLMDLTPALLMSAAMGIAVWFVGRLPISSDLLCLVIQVPLGVAIYGGLSLVSKNEELRDIWDIVMAKLRR